MAAPPWFDEPIRRLVGGRKVILVGGVPPLWLPTVETVRRFGAADVLVVATEGPGVGGDPDCTVFVVDRPDGLSILERIRRGARVQRDPPPELVHAVNGFDPDGTAVVIGTFLNESEALLGRPFVSHRRPAWLALEDKTVADDLWDRCGVRRAPSDVVPVADAAGRAQRLDGGLGTVWAGDATEGWHGGAALTRWVASADVADAAAEELGRHCERVRVMPFLEGVPCSIHGIVLPDGVVALRPVEMVTLRRGHELFYAGCATYWDPPGELRAEMRDVARRVGSHLVGAVGVRGAFTVDGVAAVDGFLPTELNPRAGAGLNTMSRGLPDGFPLMLLLELVGGGTDLGAVGPAIEDELLASADEHRSGGTWRFEDLDAAPFDGRVWFSNGRWSTTEVSETCPAATVLGGQGVARCTFDPDTWPVGPSVGRAAAAFYGWCDDELGTTVGPLTPATDVQEMSAGPRSAASAVGR